MGLTARRIRRPHSQGDKTHVAIDAPPQALHDALAVRQQARDGPTDWPHGGSTLGFVQANLTILPAALADDFLRFCQRNTKPCPLLAVSDVGSTAFPALGADLDVRTGMYRATACGDTAAGGRAAGRARALVRRPGQLCHRLLVFV